MFVYTGQSLSAVVGEAFDSEWQLLHRDSLVSVLRIRDCGVLSSRQDVYTTLPRLGEHPSRGQVLGNATFWTRDSHYTLELSKAMITC